MKIPECQFCHYKMYAIENRRKRIGYLCPNCHFVYIQHPTDYWKELRNRRSAKINQLSMSGGKPKFGSSRVVAKCSNCHMSKHVICRKIRQTKKRIKLGMSPSWKCECTKCKISWVQNWPKIEMVRMSS